MHYMLYTCTFDFIYHVIFLLVKNKEGIITPEENSHDANVGGMRPIQVQTLIRVVWNVSRKDEKTADISDFHVVWSILEYKT